MREWLNKYKIRLEELPEPRVMFTHLEHDQIFKYQKAFGYTTEDLEYHHRANGTGWKGTDRFDGN